MIRNIKSIVSKRITDEDPRKIPGEERMQLKRREIFP